MALDGSVIHNWNIDWFKMWPDADHLPEHVVPQSQPGCTIHGAAIMENGDLVFNFEALGLVRLNVHGNVVWRLPYQTHHSVHRDERGNLWVCGQRHHLEPVPEYPNYVPPFEEFTVLEVSGDGEILREISVFELFKQNDLSGLLSLCTGDRGATATGDTLHLNDAEPFPARLEAGFFDHQDVVISLRNINALVVFSRDTLRVKFACVGRTIRQHDPDFLDASTISVFDNNASGGSSPRQQSRVVTISAPHEEVVVQFAGSETAPFYTPTMGKHQWLANGNLLITEARRGRAFEVNPEGQVVWEFVNYVGSGGVDELTEVTRLPAEIAELY
jgi:hypothetical protein